MKFFTSDQIYAADKFTIEKQQISSNELMERAAVQIFNWMHLRMQGAQVKIHLFCGIGNNGGDGMALARHLKDHGYNIEVNVVNYSDKRSKDFLINLDRLKDRKIWPHFLESDCEFPVIGPDDIIVDAIFGIGLNRTPDIWVANLMKHINDSRAFVLAVDIPSGVFMNKSVEDEDAVVKANHVLSFQAPKLVFFLPETGVYSNQWEVLDIGLDAEFLNKIEAEYELIGKNEVLPMYIPREKFSHKGTFGHSLIIGGSYGKIGAVSLSAKACLNIGSGLVTTYVPQCGYLPIQTYLPEAMVLTDKNEKIISEIKFDMEPSVIGVGVGIGTEKETADAFSIFLDAVKTSLVVDADGLNLLAANKSLLKKLPSKTILTPHPKELERLIGKWKSDFEKLRKAKAFSKKYDVILIVKGAHTITIYENKGYVNTTGNPGMATAGSGDVLTGIVTGLIAQGYDALNAAIFGVYLHGVAGDIAVEQTGYQALTASKMIDSIGMAYIDLFKVPEPPVEETPQEKE
ncbi:bifunctional ADP-dependent NAD(P)H-hydrate dehydratase/NAD(P)H-hydrate epimerase [Maribacter sp. HTCC2170]|uniref:bifunctional ADP-dependent NAD(P)H-hydrate dehydratase/NAD(P)H-hydrate epimerase n=1 Tax=Maribacter sp. (strain HTCC2170 / KCCM 42371) TaxID=313603 RepID=UPI00006B4879|nr:bifunctional ADP-dependent NAD(P)H-hydrate dehydratase/NAD(P)H-hydrate epimerase [Maribacter sp. HTCC2170]EAR01868.1 putative sugar kinase [Maribacter sp. HTCC2170]